MELNNKKVLVITTTDDMIGRFLIPHIKYLQSMGASVECVCNKRSEFFDLVKQECNCEMHNVCFTRFPFTPSNLKAYKALKNIVKNAKFDLVFCHQPVGGVFGRMVGKKFGIAVVYVAHGFHFFKGAPLVNRVLYKGIEKHYAKYTDSLVVMNEEDFAAAKKFKAKKNYKINGIGVDLTKYNADEKLDKVEFRKTLGLMEEDFVVVSVGELNKNKNTLTMVDAISKIDDPKVKYLVCGEGPLKEKFYKKIKSKKLEDRVFVLGFRKDIPNILNVSDVFVMPSFREGLPKSMMEAMAYGMPIIASNIRGCSDLVGKNEGGILVEPSKPEQFAKAITIIQNNKELRTKYSIRNKEFIKNYDINIVLDQMKKVYEEI